MMRGRLGVELSLARDTLPGVLMDGVRVLLSGSCRMTRVKILDRKSPRLQGYDYSQAGGYFVSFNTKDRIESLSTISPLTIVGTHGNVSLKLTEIGSICHNEIIQTGTLRKDVFVDEFIVMPNHIHIILLFTEKRDKQTLGSVIRNIKARVKKYANQHAIPFARQGNFHDHIIRDEKELDRIREYIRNNPLKRLQDKEL